MAAKPNPANFERVVALLHPRPVVVGTRLAYGLRPPRIIVGDPFLRPKLRRAKPA